MNWRWRALALRQLARAPGGRWLYQQLQRRFGLHRRPDFVRTQLAWQAHLARGLAGHGARLEGARLVEVGTGWVPLVPIGFWLCGAARVETYDIERWLLPRALHRALCWIARNRAELAELWRGVAEPATLETRLDRLAELAHRPLELLEAAGIRYRAPADARSTGLADASIDIHYSIQVFEHVEAGLIPEILSEAARILKPGGWSAHQIDPSDHFSHFDPAITGIHFLRFSERRWREIAGHALAHHNRLRVHEHIGYFEASALEVLETTSKIDPRALEALEAGFELAEPYRQMAPEDVCRRSLFLYARRPQGA